MSVTTYKLYKLLGWLCCFINISFSQGKTAQDSSILSLIKNEDAFLHWQISWQDISPTFNLDSFHASSQYAFPGRVLNSFSQFDITKVDYPSMVAFSPDGLKAVAYGYAQTCEDDYCSILLYDLQLHNVFELSAVGSQYPPFNGFAWLNNDVLIMVGEAYHMSKADVDSVAPSISVFDVRSKTVHNLTGEYIVKDKNFKTPDNHVTIEPDLFLDFK
jgi:hypothetical protein